MYEPCDDRPVTRWKDDRFVTDWEQFTREVRSRGGKLLSRLDEFPNSVLVAGCQRSGTTMLSRLINGSDGMTCYWFGPDDELDAALLLSGYVDHQPLGRYCFQTTYLNDRYREYYEHDAGQRLVWVLRNPRSAVYSMLNNWDDRALAELFTSCAAPNLRRGEATVYRLAGTVGFSRIRRACRAYNAKIAQLLEIHSHLKPEQLMVVHYNDLVSRPSSILASIYSFIDLPYRSSYSSQIHPNSLARADAFSNRERDLVDRLCMPIYNQARCLTATS